MFQKHCSRFFFARTLDIQQHGVHRTQLGRAFFVGRERKLAQLVAVGSLARRSIHSSTWKEFVHFRSFLTWREAREPRPPNATGSANCSTRPRGVTQRLRFSQPRGTQRPPSSLRAPFPPRWTARGARWTASTAFWTRHVRHGNARGTMRVVAARPPHATPAPRAQARSPICCCWVRAAADAAARGLGAAAAALTRRQPQRTFCPARATAVRPRPRLPRRCAEQPRVTRAAHSYLTGGEELSTGFVVPSCDAHGGDGGGDAHHPHHFMLTDAASLTEMVPYAGGGGEVSEGGGGGGGGGASGGGGVADAKGGKRGRGAAAPPRGGVRSTSTMRGVTHHCRTGRWEAHLWQAGKQGARASLLLSMGGEGVICGCSTRQEPCHSLTHPRAASVPRWIRQ